MRVIKCSHSKILVSCNLLNFNYQIDPYIGCEHLCSYCYGLNEAKTNWGKEILIYEDLIEQLSNELTRLEPQIIYLGMNCDPYQQLEKEYCQTRKILELFSERGFSASILTKSGLVVRDIDLLKVMPGSSVGTSITFSDENTRKRFEKKAPSNNERIKALKKMKKAGIKTYTLICPVMPFITDIKAMINLVAPYSDDIWIYRLQIGSANDQNWMNLRSILIQYYPELTERYKEIVFSEDHLYWDDVKSKIAKIKQKHQINIVVEI